MPDLSSLVGDIYSLFDQTKDHNVSEENLDAFADNLKELLRARLARSDRNGDSIRFSNLGRPDRQLWYMTNAEKREEITPKTALKFLYGDVIEQLMLFLCKEAGHAVEREQEEIEVDGIKGHIDAIIDGVTVDVKSASPMSYAKFEKGTLFENDPFGYIGQISGYASVLTPKTGGAFLAFDKVHGDICLLKIGPSITNAFDVPKRIAHLREIVSAPAKPPRCYPDEEDGKSGNRKLGTQCSYCAFKEDCWMDANGGMGLRTFLYSGKPRFLTKVTRTPDRDGMTFRSKFEAQLYGLARAHKKSLDFEPKSAIIPYSINYRYQPDFVLPNGILVEAKGQLDVADRRKMVAVKAARPDLDIRFVFQSARSKLSRYGKTYGEWATSAGFPWAEGSIPLEWWNE